jgi:serine/threonine protein kinase
VHEVGEEQGVPYIAMQLVRGTTLAALLDRARSGHTDTATSTIADRSGKIAMEDIVRVIERAARALHAAHEAGLVHRDIKPGNIMITRRVIRSCSTSAWRATSATSRTR